MNIQAHINIDFKTGDLRLYIPDLTESYVYISDQVTQQFILGCLSRNVSRRLDALKNEEKEQE